MPLTPHRISSQRNETGEKVLLPKRGTQWSGLFNVYNARRREKSLLIKVAGQQKGRLGIERLNYYYGRIARVYA